MNTVLAELIDTGRVTSADGTTLELHCGSIPREEGEFLQGIIADIRPTVGLEVGLAHGISALFICEALQMVSATRHIIIDPYQITEHPRAGSFKGVGLNNLKRAGYEYLIDFHGMPSDRVLPQLEAQRARIDFAFIDGFHTFDHTLIDFFYIDRLLNVGGVVVLDDANWPSVRKLCRFIATNRGYRVFRCLVPPPGFRLLLKRQILTLLSCAGRAASRSRTLRRVLNPCLIEPDEVLGLVLGSRCIAFQKQADDTRRYDAHHDF